jgi:hypothetical protein
MTPRAIATTAGGVVLAIGGAVGFMFVVMRTSGREASVPVAKTLDPSPPITATATAVRAPPDWIEEEHVTEVDIRAITHGPKPRASYAVGANGRILRRYDNAWTAETSGTARDLRGVAEILGRVCAVGDGGVATCLLDPSKPKWTVEKTGTQEDLLGLAEHYGFVAVGRKGTIVRRDNEAGWRREESGTKEDLFGVAGDYAVGAHGTILHHDDLRWRPVASPTTEDLYAIETDLDEVVAVGAHGIIVRLGDPRAGFHVQQSGTPADLFAVTHGGGYTTYAVGAGGVVLEASGTASWNAQRADTQRDLHAVDCSIPTMFIGGDHGTFLSRKY